MAGPLPLIAAKDKAMSRAYRGISPKKHMVYSTDQVMALYKVSRNTTTNWKNEGLRASDDRTPSVFNGSELKRFHEARRLTSTSKLRIGQFKCFSCKERVFPERKTVVAKVLKSERYSVSGNCPSCFRLVVKTVGVAEFDQISTCVDTNAGLASLDEGIGPVPSGIGKMDESPDVDWFVQNDRTLHDWLTYSGRYDSKTVAAHLATIRDFEAFCGGEVFQKYKPSDAARYREHLKARVAEPEATGLSVSTVRHRTSHLKAFFEWLLNQKGFAGLDKTIPSCLELPKKFAAVSFAADDAPVPTLDEAIKMITAMSLTTPLERRDRAMVCIAFLGALRADTVTSLRIGHFEQENRTILQNGRQSRTKNGKSVRITFFPVSPMFARTVADWQLELRKRGFHDDDPLFPDDKTLAPNNRPYGRLSPMSSTYAISRAFKKASSEIGLSFSPHSAKHCIGLLGWDFCRTPEQTKAWSLNMGHENEAITEKYYSKIHPDRIEEIFQDFGERPSETIDDKELMLLYHDHELIKGTPNFERARRLVEERRYRKSELYDVIDDSDDEPLYQKSGNQAGTGLSGKI
jgi:integrase